MFRLTIMENKSMLKGIFIAIMFVYSGSACAQSPIASHVVLISIDGFHPDMYEDSTWPASNLRELMRRGTYADHMLSVFPSYTYPSHTAMVTRALISTSRSGAGVSGSGLRGP
jgi:predicted AlkP superfamily pyrophosphatase or phosphodiesterase